jgi:hypothetical protein
VRRPGGPVAPLPEYPAMDAPTIALVVVPLLIIQLSLMGYALYDL